MLPCSISKTQRVLEIGATHVLPWCGKRSRQNYSYARFRKPLFFEGDAALPYVQPGRYKKHTASSKIADHASDRLISTSPGQLTGVGPEFQCRRKKTSFIQGIRPKCSILTAMPLSYGAVESILRRTGIDCSGLRAIADESISGASDERAGFRQMQQLMPCFRAGADHRNRKPHFRTSLRCINEGTWMARIGVAATGRQYSQTASERRQITGLTDMDLNKISTSHVERSNLTIRTFMKRFTRLSLGFSKKLENLAAAVALHVAHYNFCRIHSTLRTTAAMARRLYCAQMTGDYA